MSILVCCIYLIYYISTLHTSPSPSLLSSTFVCFPVFGHKPLPLLFSLSFFLSLPSFPSEGALLKIRPGGFFNVSLEVGFFFSSWFCQQRCQPNTRAFPLIWPFSTVFDYFLTDLLLLPHHVNLHESFTFCISLKKWMLLAVRRNKSFILHIGTSERSRVAVWKEVELYSLASHLYKVYLFDGKVLTTQLLDHCRTILTVQVPILADGLLGLSVCVLTAHQAFATLHRPPLCSRSST